MIKGVRTVSCFGYCCIKMIECIRVIQKTSGTWLYVEIPECRSKKSSTEYNTHSQMLWLQYCCIIQGCGCKIQGLRLQYPFTMVAMSRGLGCNILKFCVHYVALVQKSEFSLVHVECTETVCRSLSRTRIRTRIILLAFHCMTRSRTRIRFLVCVVLEPQYVRTIPTKKNPYP